MVRVSDANRGSTSRIDFDHLSGIIISCASRVVPPSVQKVIIEAAVSLNICEEKMANISVVKFSKSSPT